MATLAPISGIVIGRQSRREAGPRLASRIGKGQKVLLIADPGLAATGLIGDVEASLAQAGLKSETFSALTSDPTIAQTDHAIGQALRLDARGIVALGGGSALDLAKAAAACAFGHHSAGHYQLCENELPPNALPCLAIPTTSGTGSEATRTAILTRPDGAKVWLWGDSLKPVEILLDPEASATLPAALTAATGLDALVHALEAATNANANAANNVFAHEAIRLVVRHLAAAVRDGADLAAREGLARAACLAGIAIDNGGTAVAHNIGHALGSIAKIHHGAAVAAGMAATLAWNVAGDDGRFAEAAAAMGLEAAADLPAAFADLCAGVGVPTRIDGKVHGIDAARLAAQMARPENAAMRKSNFRTISEADLADFAACVLG